MNNGRELVVVPLRLSAGIQGNWIAKTSPTFEKYFLSRPLGGSDHLRGNIHVFCGLDPAVLTVGEI
jgi:hypothetical protein